MTLDNYMKEYVFQLPPSVRLRKAHTMLTMLDAAVLPDTLPPVDAILIYLSSPGTLYGYTPDEVSRAKAHARRFLTCWVAPAGQGAVAGAAAGLASVNEANDLGVREGDALLLDCEESRVRELIADGYVQAWRDTVTAAHRVAVGYTSLDQAPHLAAIMPTVYAAWDDDPTIDAGYVGHQYSGGAGHGWDLSVVVDSLPLSYSDPSEAPMPGDIHSPALFTAPTHTGDGYWRVTVDGHV